MSISGGGGTKSKSTTVSPMVLGQLDMYNPLKERAFSPLEMYSGEYVAPMTAEQAASAQLGRETLRGLATIDPTQVAERYKTYISPQIKEMYGGPGSYYSSERFGAERKGMEEYLLGREQQAQSAAEALSTYETEGLGGLGRKLEQQKLEAQLQEWLRTRPEYSPYLQMLMTLLTGVPTVSESTSGTAGSGSIGYG